MGFWLMFFVYAALFVLTDLLTPKPELEDAKPAGIGDFQFPTASEGRVVPLLWGTCMQKGPNVTWWGDLRQVPITHKVKTGLFSSENQTVGFKYSLGIQQALCRGPDVQMLGVWIGEKRVFEGLLEDGDTFTIDEPELFGGDKLGNGGVIGTLRFHAGSLTQAPSSYLSQFQKEPPEIGDTPGYNGECYVAPDTEPTYVGNSTSIKPWKFELRRIPNGLGLTMANAALNGGNDANIMNVILETMTNTNWGLSIDPAEINTTNFTTKALVLASEGNGFSMILDRPIEAEELIEMLEKQADGVIFFNQVSGKWEMALARDDYDVDLIPELDASNILEIRSFTRSTWEGTTNQLRIEFHQRTDEYKQAFGFAQDMANVRIQGGANVSATESYPGVKDKALADAIAWREIRTLAYPLAQMQLVVDRTFYLVHPSDVFALTDEDLGVIRMPVRVKRADLGELADGRIVLDVVQDVFRAAAGTFGPPGDSGWGPPADELVEFPADQQEAFEAPRALTYRDPFATTADADKLFAFARKQGVEVTFRVMERHAVGTPGGAFSEVGEVWGFAFLGELSGALPVGSAYPAASLTIVPTPDTQATLLDALPSVSSDLVELGTDLLTLLMVDNEFLLCRSAQASGANVQLLNVYRGVLDSVQEAHASGADVWLVFVGAGISDETVPAGNNVDVKLLPRSATDVVDEGDAITIAFAMTNRVRRPYAPSELSLNGTRFATTASLEGTGTGETDGIDLDFMRRDFRTADGHDEIAALGVDAPTLFPDYPAAHTTTHEVDVRNDPNGTNTLLFTQDLGALATDIVERLDILQATDGVVPARLRFQLRSKHTYQSVLYSSRYDLAWDFDITSVLSGKFNFGALDTNDVSNVFTVANGAIDHAFDLSTAFTAGNIEYRINGGAWTVLIAAGAIAGLIPETSLNNGDTIEVRHLSTDVGAQKFLTMRLSATLTAYAILFV